MLHSVDGEVQFSKLGETPFLVDSEKLPIQLGGLLNCRIDSTSSAFMSTSNRMFVQYEGEGSFSVERFEQTKPELESWLAGPLEVGQSRMIYSLRDGMLAIDSRKLAETSQCIIEIPFGRVALKRALLGLEIEFDPRGEIFSFVLECEAGQVRFTDKRGENYTLRSGQRLSGAGARMTPSIEIGEMTNEWEERLDSFEEMIQQFQEPANSLASYEAQFQLLERADSQMPSKYRATNADSSRRPIVIERASSPDPVTPFRGEIPPPSAYQTDIF